MNQFEDRFILEIDPNVSAILKINVDFGYSDGNLRIRKDVLLSRLKCRDLDLRPVPDHEDHMLALPMGYVLNPSDKYFQWLGADFLGKALIIGFNGYEQPCSHSFDVSDIKPFVRFS
jgi:hypothetical protein